uniref:Uncharacterized protein n=1 Tax=Panagrolaimus superbus TaxID=310955 RepID=A0A914YMJ5_9BILA
MSLHLTRAEAQFCENLCDIQKEFCVRPPLYTGPYFCIDKALLKRGLRFIKGDRIGKRMKMSSDSAAAAAENGTDLISVFILIFAIITLFLTLFELIKLRKINNEGNNDNNFRGEYELQSFANINHVEE